MLGAVKRALGLYADKEAWQKVVVHAMECDFSWKKSAGEYIAMYRRILEG